MGGVLAKSPVYVYLTSDLADFISDDTKVDAIGMPFSPTAVDILDVPSGTMLRVLADALVRTSSATLAHSFKDDYYNHIHISPARIDLGNILSSQVRDVTIWNTFPNSQTCATIDEDGTEGIELAVTSELPKILRTMELYTTQVRIFTEGPSVLDGVYSLVFSDETATITISGKRVVVWPFIPQDGMRETIEFLTDIIKTRVGEQRISNRVLPRRGFQLSHLMDEHDLSILVPMAKVWANRPFGVPVWTESTHIGPVDSDADTLYFDTTNCDYAVGGSVVIYQSHTFFETVEIASMTDSSLTLDLPVVRSYADAYVAPIVFGHALDGFNISRTKDLWIHSSVDMTTAQSNDLAFSDKPQLNGKDLLMDRSVMVGALSESIKKEYDIFDSEGIGDITLIDARDVPDHVQAIQFHTLDRAELWSVRRWLYSINGRQKSFYLPTWNRDIQPTEDILFTDITITGKYTGHCLYVTDTKDILIMLKDGTYFLRQVTSSAVSDDGQTETFNINESLGSTITLDELELICYINLVRLNADRIEINHISGCEATIIIPVIGVEA